MIINPKRNLKRFITNGTGGNGTMTKCSKNLTKHLKLLKMERNRLLTLHDNGYTVSPKDYADYIQHKNYVTTLLHTEKLKAFEKMLKKTVDN